jgi:hypothetical protein
LQGADAVVLALRFTVLKAVVDQIADPLTDKIVVVPSNPLTVDAGACDRRRSCRPGSRAVDPNGRLRAGEGRRDRRSAVIDRWDLIGSPLSPVEARVD